MKTQGISLCGLLAGMFLLAGTRSHSADFAAPIPDLKIMQISEIGNSSWVQVKNVGTGNAGACKLQVWYLEGGLWKTDESGGWDLINNVPALAPGASIWIQFSLNSGIGAEFNYYKVDSKNQVSESKEANNGIYIPYGPAG
jgi:hypothetical protein